MGQSHPKCARTPEGIVHDREVLGGRLCVGSGCDRPPASSCGPLWCPDHDVERLGRITGQFEDLAASLNRTNGGK